LKPRHLILWVLMGLLACDRSGRRSVSGTIETDEVRVASRYGGRVAQLHAEEGDTLRPGQPIVTLDATELRARRDQAAALLEELVRGPRPAEVDAARADWQSLVAELDWARVDEKRAAELFQQQVIAAEARDAAVSRARRLAEAAEAAKRRYELLAEGTRPERIAQARAQLAEVDAQLREMQIVSPTNTVLEVLNVKVGDVLPANREVATLVMPDRLWVRVYVPEPWLGRIQLGQKLDVRTDSSSETFQGVVEQINRQAEFTPRNVQTVEDRVRQVFGVKVRLPGDTGALRAGMSVDVFFPDVPAIAR
jgi:multidrug resistance efflux pump